MTLIGAVLIFSPIIMLWIGALMAFFGLLFAPIAAIYCSRLARRNGLSPKRYAIMGGVYSLVFFVPAVYLVARLRGRIVPRKLIIATYIALHVYWTAGPLGFALLVSFGVGPGMFLPLFFIWVAALWRLIYTEQDSWRASADTYSDTILGYAWLLPFMLAYLSSVASILFVFIVPESWWEG